MFAHLLVPLDGSASAEAVLPMVSALAARHGAEVTLLHLIERDAPAAVHGQSHLRDAASATAYLDAVRARAFPDSVHVHRHVHTESYERVPRGIIDHATELRADLIVLCTHGRGGLRHRLFGNIAEHIVRAGIAPVLLVPPDGDARAYPFRRMLVPLDGDPSHEAALDAAAALAAEYRASIILVMVVPTLGTLPADRTPSAMLPGTTSALLDIEQEKAIDYVNSKMDRLESLGVAVEARVARGDAVHLIREGMIAAGADIVIAASHGTAGLDAFWTGAVTPRVAARSRVPLLLVPAAPVNAGSTAAG